jgi:hypothetical protein
MQPAQAKHYIRTMRRYLRKHPTGSSLKITRSGGQAAGTMFVNQDTGAIQFSSDQLNEPWRNKAVAIILGLLNTPAVDKRIMLNLCRAQRLQSPSRLPG